MKNSNDLTTKESIIKATKEVLKKKGNVTIKDIADAAFVNIAAINYHFGSKDNLIQIVIEQMMAQLRAQIVETIRYENVKKLSFEALMMELINVIFTFAEENSGVINYSFLQVATQSESANVLVEFFLSDKEFTSIILEQLAAIFPNDKPEQLFSKYLIIFSSFAVPFFLNFSMTNHAHDGGKEVESFFNRYKDSYIEELRRFLTP